MKQSQTVSPPDTTPAALLTLPIDIIFRPRMGEYRAQVESHEGSTCVSVDFVRSPNNEEALKALAAEYFIDDPAWQNWLCDPWNVRQEFLERDPALFADFTDCSVSSTSGGWDINHGIAFEAGPDLRESVARAETMLIDNASEWQALIRDALRTPHSDWDQLATRHNRFNVAMLRRPLPLEVGHRNGLPVGRIICPNGAFLAIAATMQLDAMRGYNFKSCACCGRPFRTESKHERRYCDYDCAHLAAVRRSRARK